MTLDQEEQEILDAYEADLLQVRPPSAEEIEAFKAAADKTFRKDRRITIRLYEHDYQGIQKKALQMGIPYQTLISGIIHRYVEGDLVPKQQNAGQ